MATFTVVGKRGMIYIPKPIREKARLEERIKIEIDLNEDGNIIIKKVADVRAVRGAWKDKEEIVNAIESLKDYWNAWKP
ncbi:MAG: AbrB/MazE/SpoVT family DNA-binding domain-containing protein [Methanophagales archaeon]|nr:AbrB/MazE/SpoVT family DNA-binding domain-containing protein [Methanophagales archaeon]